MRRPRPALAAGALALVLTVPLGGATASAEDRQPSSPSATTTASRAGEASAALAAVEAIFGDASRGGVGAAGPLDATLALRDLSVLLPALSPSERREADAYLARPSDHTGAPLGVSYSVREAPRVCNKRLCVHRVASTRDKATLAFATKALTALSKVHSTYVGAGYRKPLPDGAAPHDGGDKRPDVYLADIGGQGVFGYCTSDEPHESGVYTQWAYCVLDNDYATAQFPEHTPLENLRVTAAHEYFHAVQFAYDFTEDAYFMEGTATWAEDELFDSVNDNVSYLRFGPMGTPGASIDANRNGLEVYGAWSLFRHLTERLPRTEGGLPVLVRTMWRRADSTPGAPDDYSLQAIRNAVESAGGDLSSQLASYAVANRHPARSYEEGKADNYPVAPLAGKGRLSTERPSFHDRRRTNHLTARTFRLEPSRHLRSSHWRVRLTLDLPAPVRGSAVRVTVYRPNGSFQTTAVGLDRRGDAVTSRPFDARHVRAVEVTALNTSQRIVNCFSSTSISCQGEALDDHLVQDVSARLVRR